jgi:hypothetical protein
MFRRRACITLALVTSVLVAGSLPAQAAGKVAQKKSYSSKGKSGSVVRYVDGKTHYLSITADDTGGKGSRCTETWIDLSTKNPHKHFNPGVLVNCTGKKITLPKEYVTDWIGVRGVGLIVCEVPNTSGRIVRNSSNCSGNLGSMYQWSGKSYGSFRSPGISRPNGAKQWIFR